VLDIWGLLDPNRILQKPKLHLLEHLIEDIRRFGPATLFATETFESYNSVFRLCSVLSNHQAPSRDISLQFGDMDRFKHQTSGGFWRNPHGKPTQAGAAVRQYFDNPAIRRRLGWTMHDEVLPGMILLVDSHTNMRFHV
jgi:hypothetical protein